MTSLYLLDGTWELFRNHFAAPSRTAPTGEEIGAVAGLATSMLAFLRRDDVTHLAVATDRVIESFRNDLFDGYKTGEGIDEALLAQFPLAEEALASLGLVVWPMVEFEADDALATAARLYVPHFAKIVVATPDKDLAQVVRDPKIVQWNRMKDQTFDEAAVEVRLGVRPESVPDYLGLVGDKADGIPGLPGFGAKTASRLLQAYGHIEDVPRDPEAWSVTVRGAKGLAETLVERREEALLYRRLATLRIDVPLEAGPSDLEWRGVPRWRWRRFCARLGLERLATRPHRWQA